MVARNSPAGSLVSGILNPLVPGLLSGGNVGAGTTAITPVYPYSPPSTGQAWPRPY